MLSTSGGSLTRPVSRPARGPPLDTPRPDACDQPPRHTGQVAGDEQVAAVVFDLDGVLLDSEQVWDDVRRAVVAEHGRTWDPAAAAAGCG